MRTVSTERGAALPTIAIMLVVILGMAAFAVDLGWLFLNSNRIQKTADAAALAGVVNLPTNVIQAQTDAAGAVSANGFGGATIAAVPIPVNRLQVDVTTAVPTFFMNVFGIEEVDITRRSTAQYILPVPLGSDDRCFGAAVANLGGSNCERQGFWAAISAPNTDKWQGDAYTARCYGDEDAGASWECANANPELRTSGYYYGVEVAAGSSSLNVSLYDPGFHDRDGPCAATSPCDFELSALGGVTTTYTLYAPDTTPYDPTNNPPTGCSGAYGPGEGPQDGWDSLCTISTPLEGIYVLRVATSGDTGGTNQFAISSSTATNPQPRVYGLGDMGIFNNNLGAFATIDLAEIDQVHAGKTLNIGLFDSGDSRPDDDGGGGDVSLTIVDPSGTPVPCAWSGRRDDGVTGPSGSGTCTIVTTVGGTRRYNGMWLDITIRVPDDYVCSADCFWEVQYNVTGNPTDRTTWKVALIGNPVRLVPNAP